MKIFLALIVGVVLLGGCAATPTGPELHSLAKQQVQLGMTRGEFNALMKPAFEATEKDQRRSVESFTEDSSTVDIVFVRSAWIRDGALTDDEYTPYVFRNGRLASYGWRSIGGMKVTSGDIAKAKSGSTRVKVNTGNSGFKPYCPPSKYPIYGC